MDPQTCLERILEAISERDLTEFHYACADLAEWLGRGGFPPTMPTERLGSRYVVGKKRWQPVRSFLTDRWGIQSVDPYNVKGGWELVKIGDPVRHYIFDPQTLERKPE